MVYKPYEPFSHTTIVRSFASMNSFLLIEKQKNLHEKMSSEFCLKQGIHPLDTTVINTQEPITPDEASQKIKGIARIRNIIKTISLKPLRGEKKAVIILHSETLSIPAQNALLKTLEEPPPHTIIILTSENKYLLLPTILSRCQVIGNENAHDISPNEEETLILPNSLSVSSALKYAEALSKDKTEAIRFVESRILRLHKELQERVKSHDKHNNTFFLRTSLSSHLETYKLIKSTNINLRFALEHLILSIFSDLTESRIVENNNVS